MTTHNPYEGCASPVWCEKFGLHRDFTLGYCGDADRSEDCRSCPANERKGQISTKEAREEDRDPEEDDPTTDLLAEEEE
jgi:hypothetical protein